MTAREALVQASQRLSAITPDAFFETEVLLCHLLKLSKAQLFAYGERELTPGEEKALDSLLQRRLAHEPLAYLLGSCEFYGRDFSVDWRVLIPRPETELLVEKALGLAQPLPPTLVAEIGTGCGAIAITLALGLPRAQIYATDISPDALEVAWSNCQRHKVVGRVQLLLGDMLEPLPQPVDLLVANLPYIPTGELPRLPPEVRLYEPVEALDGGPDGLGHIRRLLTQAGSKLKTGGSFLLEIGQGQAERVKALIAQTFPGAVIEFSPDLAGIPRVVRATLTASEGDDKLWREVGYA